jgi:peptide/nickel transport system substrate-binding protein
VKHKFLFVFVTVLVLSSMILAGCTPAATAVAPTKAPEVPAGAVKMDYKEVPFAAQKLAAPDCNYGGNIKAIETVDELTVKFSLCKADPAFLGKIAVNAFGIYDKGQLDAYAGDAAKMNALPVGTGPYYVKEWVRGDHITFAANPNYWGGTIANKTFIMKWNKEAAARLLDLQSGNADGIEDIGTDDYATVTGDANLKLYPRVQNSFLYLGFNVDTPPYDNEKVRQAFALAIDREKIVKDFYPQGAVAAVQFLPPGVKPGYTADYKGYKYDPTTAKQMLTDAGFDFTKE